jgi:septal ring factor EnvC (AmiA/AmiB activator)
MAEQGLVPTIRQLALALMNASLLLLALCLWLAWAALSAAERVSTHIKETVQTVTPLREDLAALTAEIAVTRDEVAALRAGKSADLDVAFLERQLARLHDQVKGLASSVAALTPNNKEVIDQVIMNRCGFAGGSNS